METKENRSDEGKLDGNSWDTSCCAGPDGHKMMEECCKSVDGEMDCSSMMCRCIKGYSWFPFIPLVLGISLFVLCYYLEAEIARIPWMGGAGLMILMGTFGLIMMNNMKWMCRGPK